MLSHTHGQSEDRLMTLEEAAVTAGVSVRTLARYRRSGALEVVKIGRRVLCTLDSIERALVRRSLQTLGREITAPEQEPLPLSGWFRLLLELSEANPEFEHPDRLRLFVEETLRRHPAMCVREFTVAHARAVGESLAERGLRPTLLPPLLGFPDATPVIDIVRRLHSQFSW